MGVSQVHEAGWTMLLFKGPYWFLNFVSIHPLLFVFIIGVISSCDCYTHSMWIHSWYQKSLSAQDLESCFTLLTRMGGCQSPCCGSQIAWVSQSGPWPSSFETFNKLFNFEASLCSTIMWWCESIGTRDTVYQILISYVGNNHCSLWSMSFGYFPRHLCTYIWTRKTPAGWKT